jgi:hypothetical protein
LKFLRMLFKRGSPERAQDSSVKRMEMYEWLCHQAKYVVFGPAYEIAYVAASDSPQYTGTGIVGPRGKTLGIRAMFMHVGADIIGTGSRPVNPSRSAGGRRKNGDSHGAGGDIIFGATASKQIENTSASPVPGLFIG